MKKTLAILLCWGVLASLANANTVTLTGVKKPSLACTYHSVSISGEGTVNAQCDNDSPPVTGTTPDYVMACEYKTVTLRPPYYNAERAVTVGGGIYVTCRKEGETTPGNPTIEFAGMAAQLITFVADFPAMTVGATTQLSATVNSAAGTKASSGLPIKFESASPAICKVEGSTVTALSAGTCWITANQQGNSVFFAAQQKKTSFRVNDAP
jgi:hypothetical protein